MQAADARLVTPEAVVLQFDTAGLGSRFIARALDTLVQVAAVIALVLVASAAESGGAGSTALGIFFLIAVFAVIFLYPALLETLWRGRTVGKAAVGLRVVTREGAPIRFRHAAIRSAMFIVDGLLVGPSVGVLTLLLSRDNQRLGDIVAGTIVVRERSGARAPVAMSFPVPIGLESYVASLDVSGLRGEDYEAVRALLVRGRSLDPRVRYDLARQLGTTIATRMHHSPPPAIGPEWFLACVAAAFQQRFAAPVAWGGSAAPVAPPPTPFATVTPPAPPPGDEQWGAVVPRPAQAVPVDRTTGDGFAPPS
jgi:uncharacterized RDD family membrane protein YckC